MRTLKSAWRSAAGAISPGLWTVLVLGAAIRVAVAWSYWPGLFYSDSWLYLGMATGGSPVAFAPDRPSGYPLLLRLSMSVLGSTATLVSLQHAAGLFVGLLVYLLLDRMGVRRWLAVLGAGIVLLDGYAIALEQHFLPEAFFTLALLASMAVVAVGRMSLARVAFSGVLLATAILLRTAAVFAIPVWGVFVLTGRDDLRLRLVGMLGLVLPLLAYMGLHAAATGQFTLTESDGWFLYGRVAEIGSCQQIRVPRSAALLCREPQLRGPEDPSEYVYGLRSPASLAFGPLAGNSESVVHANSVLREYAFAVIEQRPLAYLKLAVSDFLRFFELGAGSPGREDLAQELPSANLLLYWDDPPLRRRLFPHYRATVGFPGGLAGEYVRVVHTPRWLLAILILAAIGRVGLAVATRGKVKAPHSRVIALFTVVAIAILFGTTATTLFRVRYLIPTVPLIVCAGALAVSPARKSALTRDGEQPL
jgi:hypothetical protein